MPKKINLDHISIVLNKPQFSENIGAAARAAQNMGIPNLIIVNAVDYNPDAVNKMATHAAMDVVDSIKFYNSLKEALSSFSYVVGTTARIGKQRQAVNLPSKTARKLISIIKENKTAVVFGPEDRGLTNEDLRLCHELVCIPTAGFSSLNLAQAVMIICYELCLAVREEAEEFVPRLANRYELDGMYEQLKEILVRIDYIKPDSPEYWMNNIRRFFSRIGLSAGEVGIIRGICRQVNWYGDKCYKDGLNAVNRES
jgi:tRNA/rRNA methyltransferase